MSQLLTAHDVCDQDELLVSYVVNLNENVKVMAIDRFESTDVSIQMV